MKRDVRGPLRLSKRAGLQITLADGLLVAAALVAVLAPSSVSCTGVSAYEERRSQPGVGSLIPPADGHDDQPAAKRRRGNDHANVAGAPNGNDVQAAAVGPYTVIVGLDNIEGTLVPAVEYEHVAVDAGAAPDEAPALAEVAAGSTARAEAKFSMAGRDLVNIWRGAAYVAAHPPPHDGDGASLTTLRTSLMQAAHHPGAGSFRRADTPSPGTLCEQLAPNAHHPWGGTYGQPINGALPAGGCAYDDNGWHYHADNWGRVVEAVGLVSPDDIEGLQAGQPVQGAPNPVGNGHVVFRGESANTNSHDFVNAVSDINAGAPVQLQNSRLINSARAAVESGKAVNGASTGWDAGHIRARCLGGGKDAFNFVPQAPIFNRHMQGGIELALRELIKYHNIEIRIRIQYTYDDGPARLDFRFLPTTVRYQAWTTGGVWAPANVNIGQVAPPDRWNQAGHLLVDSTFSN